MANKIVINQDNNIVNTDGESNVIKIISEGIQGATGSTTFSALTDTPANLVANKFLKVNSSANAIEYADELNVTNLSYTPSTRVLASSTGDNATLPLVDTTNAGLLSASDKSKLDGIEASATADQTDAEIKTAYENNSNTNAFTDAEKTKLTGIESNATADQTNAEIRAAVEAATDSNVFTDADHTKLNGIEAGATADQTNAEIKTAYEANSDTNAFTDADHSKLDGIEATADVTDATNVDAAGAVMNTDSTTAGMGFVVDEDNMASNSATKIPTQQSVKAYVDANSSDTTYTAGTGLSLSGTTFNVDQIALTTVQTAANESAHLGLTTQEGDIVVRSDQNKSYVRNSGTAGTMADFTELLTPTDQVLSVNGNTGAITAAQIAAAVEAATDSNTFTDADHTKLNGIEASATADQTASEIKTLLQSDKLTVSEIADDAITADKLANSINSEIAANTAKVTNATHTGDVTGSTALTIADDAVTYAKMQNVSATDRVLGRDSSGAGVVEEITPANLRTMINVEDGATADQTATEIRSLVDSASDSNVFTDADHSKLNGIEATADVTDATNVDAAGAVMNSDLDGKGELLVGDGSGDPTALAAGTDGYVLKANSSTATGLEWSAAGSGGDTNQNAFSNVAVSGQDTVAADSTTDTLNIAAGSNVTITTNASNDTVTIASTDTNTTYTVGDGGLTQNNFTNTLKTKLDGIETSADVTDEINVAAAGAVMDGDFTSNGFMKRTGAGSYTVDTNTYLTSIPSSYLQNLSEDTTPQLGGDLDMNSKFISSGILGIKNTGSQSELRLYCEVSNAHYASIKAPAHADFSGNITYTLPSGYGSNGQVLKSDGSGGTSWVDQTAAYTNSDVDSHLNQSNPTSGHVLSWNGSDYAWVAQSSGGGGGISNVVEDTTPQLGGDLDMNFNNIIGTGTITANSVANNANGMRKITASTSAPTSSDGADGDLWVKYTA